MLIRDGAACRDIIYIMRYYYFERNHAAKGGSERLADGWDLMNIFVESTHVILSMLAGATLVNMRIERICTTVL